MAYKDYTVRINFNDGVHNYDFPYVSQVEDPKEGMKAVVIEGNRGDGSIVIPGGKKSQTITVHGKLFDEDGYKDLTTLIQTMKNSVTTDVATLTMKHFDPDYSGGGSWINDWSYSVRRIEEIEFPESLRTGIQEYNIRFLVLSY